MISKGPPIPPARRIGDFVSNVADYSGRRMVKLLASVQKEAHMIP